MSNDECTPVYTIIILCSYVFLLEFREGLRVIIQAKNIQVTASFSFTVFYLSAYI